MANDETETLAWRVEETTLNAWPALREIVLDGWLVRFAEGVSRRANSANPLSPAAAIGDEVLEGCAAFYRRHGLPVLFRVPSVTAADPALAARGFAAEGETCTLYASLDALPADADPAVTLRPRPDRIWFAAMSGLQGHSAAQAHAYRRIVGAISVPAAFASLAGEDGRIVALAYGALHRGLLCYESVITDPRQRRRGHAGRVLAALAAWAREQGATGACLQVAADNTPGLALYRAIGLDRELYRYHYRRAPAG